MPYSETTRLRHDPQEEDEKPKTYCECGQGIYAGQDYHNDYGVIYCEDCWDKHETECRRTA